MITWLNGPFGVGKTRLANELQTRLPGSFVFDPEEVGFALRKLIPPERHLEDFQDYPLWREMVAKTLLYAASDGKTPLIVPMTLVNPGYFEETIGFLRARGQEVHHVVLTASKETILNRLEKRGDGSSWAAGQLERCLDGLNRFDPGEHVQTDDLTVSGVADIVMERLGLE